VKEAHGGFKQARSVARGGRRGWSGIPGRDDEVWLARLARLAAWRVDWLAHARQVEQLIGATLPAGGAVRGWQAGVRLQENTR
jgi:hypothetical protein